MTENETVNELGAAFLVLVSSGSLLQTFWGEENLGCSGVSGSRQSQKWRENCETRLVESTEGAEV